MSEVKLFEDSASLSKAAAEAFISSGKIAIQNRNKFIVSLAGGSTPKAAYRLLGTERYASQLDWSSIYIFWGDERCVPPEHPDSNYRMASKALLNQVPIPQSNIFRIKGELDPRLAASKYEAQLRDFFGDHHQFDLVLLGMGSDGHTASLFPGTEAVHNKTDWVTANFIHNLSSWRITLTPAIINKALEVIFLVSGERKSFALQQVLNGIYQPDIYPSQIIRPRKGKLTWFVDKAAAQQL